MLRLHLILTPSVTAAAASFSADEVVAAVIRIAVGLAIVFLVHRFVRRMPWPRPFRLRFAVLHLAAATGAAVTWLVVSGALEALVADRSLLSHLDDRWQEFVFLGVIAYTIVAGLSYAVEATARAARAEAIAAQTQLAALRAQLQPHFLFNALHTVVQLIPIEPQRAADAAELVADLLRTTLEEQRDEVTLADEWRFVSRYLELERIRFGDRLVVRSDLAAGLLDEHVPAFALQTLVENAVMHGAAPRVAATEIVVTATGTRSALTLSVRNSGNGEPARAATGGTGTGLARLHLRLDVLYGSAASLSHGPAADGGFEAAFTVPRRRGTAP